MADPYSFQAFNLTGSRNLSGVEGKVESPGINELKGSGFAVHSFLSHHMNCYFEWRQLEELIIGENHKY